MKRIRSKKHFCVISLTGPQLSGKTHLSRKIRDSIPGIDWWDVSTHFYKARRILVKGVMDWDAFNENKGHLLKRAVAAVERARKKGKRLIILEHSGTGEIMNFAIYVLGQSYHVDQIELPCPPTGELHARSKKRGISLARVKEFNQRFASKRRMRLQADVVSQDRAFDIIAAKAKKNRD